MRISRIPATAWQRVFACPRLYDHLLATDSASRVIEPPPGVPKQSQVACVSMMPPVLRVVLPPAGSARLTSSWYAYKLAWSKNEPAPCQTASAERVGKLAAGPYTITANVPVWITPSQSKDPALVGASVTVR